MAKSPIALAVRSHRSPRKLAQMPVTVDPMLAALSLELPTSPAGYSFEFKWDGVRALAFSDGKNLRLQGRNENDITARYPEVADVITSLGKRSAILDGEIVALNDKDRPSFALLQQRMHVADPRSVERLMKQVPVLYVVFDLLYLDGKSLMDRPFSERRAKLESLGLSGHSWQISPARVGEGQSMLDTATKNELEGVVAKKLDSTYEPGRRSPAWRKIKIVQRQEFVIGGWTTGNNGRGIGALLIGYHNAGGGGKRSSAKLQYAGKVGSGFTAKTLASLALQLKRLATEVSPFAAPLPGPGRWSRPGGPTHFIEPMLIAEVEYRRWPAGGLVQQAAYKGLRTDKRAIDVVREV